MASLRNETRELSASSIQTASECIAFARDRIAFLADVFEGDGSVRTSDFQLSKHGANAVSEMLVEMLCRLEEAFDALNAESLNIGAE